MKRLLKNLPFDVAYFSVLWMGLVMGVMWAENVALFVSWAIAVIGCVLLVESAKKQCVEFLRKKGPRGKVFATWDATTDIAAILIFAAAAHFILAAFFLVAVLAKNGAYDEAAKEPGAA